MNQAIPLALLPVLAACTAVADEPAATVATKLLSARLAADAVAVAVSECSGRGYSVASSLVSRDGNLAAFLRDPLAGPHTIDVSQGKAYASASLRVSTATLSTTDEAAGLRFASEVIIVRGGVPIDIGGFFYGGIGVSGATQEADEECANAGIDAIRETLEFSE